MREIKFRGKRLDNGEWAKGFGVLNLDSVNGSPECWLYTRDRGVVVVDPETVGEFTGLTDKEGDDIYEGDVVKSHYHAPVVVSFKNGSFYFGDATNDEVQSIYVDNEWEIIGNIHQN